MVARSWTLWGGDAQTRGCGRLGLTALWRDLQRVGSGSGIFLIGVLVCFPWVAFISPKDSSMEEVRFGAPAWEIFPKDARAFLQIDIDLTAGLGGAAPEM